MELLLAGAIESIATLTLPDVAFRRQLQSWLQTWLMSYVDTTPASSEAAGQLRVKFSFDGLATCQNPPVSNFPIHGEGTGVLSADRSASLDMTSTIEGRVEYRAKLGGAPIEAPAGKSIRMVR